MQLSKPFLLIIITMSAFFIINQFEPLKATEVEQIRDTEIGVARKTITHLHTEQSIEVMAPKTVRVILARRYLDGEVSEEIIEETIWSMEDFWAEYEEWDLVDQDETQVVFQQQIDDISPLLKINGYFGLSEEGILTIYEGNPTDEKVIHSFFQIDTKELKSHQHQELQKGIPILSKDRYEEVLKMFSKFAKKEL